MIPKEPLNLGCRRVHLKVKVHERKKCCGNISEECHKCRDCWLINKSLAEWSFRDRPGLFQCTSIFLFLAVLRTLTKLTNSPSYQLVMLISCNIIQPTERLFLQDQTTLQQKVTLPMDTSGPQGRKEFSGQVDHKEWAHKYDSPLSPPHLFENRFWTSKYFLLLVVVAIALW